VYRVDGPQSRSVFELRIGSVLPVLRSALGRNLLAHLPESITRPFVDRELAEIAGLNGRAADEELPRSRRDVAALIARVRADGVSRCRRALLSDFTAISAPVFDFSGTAIAAVTLMGPVGVLDDALDGAVARALRTVAGSISAEAGQKAKIAS
jgi:DNA-binding IclR family transcriptional regulator